jgi:hypothetical protein
MLKCEKFGIIVTLYQNINQCTSQKPEKKRAAYQGIMGCSEMEFLDIILTKDLSLLLHAIRSPLYWRHEYPFVEGTTRVENKTKTYA